MTNKRSYKSHKEAKQVKQLTRWPVAAFLCECGFFHLGGQHGEQSRHAHRTQPGTTTIHDAAKELGVRPAIVRLLIQSRKARGDETTINTTDLHAIQQRMWEQR